MPQSRLDFISTLARWDRKLPAMRTFALSTAICALVVGCTATPRGGADAPASPSTDPGDAGGEGSGTAESVSPGHDGSSGALTSAELAGARELMPDTEPDPSRSLPEVSVSTVGLHVGGGPNDDASKAPFRAAVEQRFGAFLECYKKVAAPEKGGTFGVDLFIPREGGHPEVRQPRTAMQGNEFRDCVTGAFGAVEFSRPPKGPTVISYSVRFELRD